MSDDDLAQGMMHDADLGPAPAAEQTAPRERVAGSNLDREPPKRIAPKLSLKGQRDFVQSLYLRAKPKSGADFTETYVLIEPIDLERLNDLAEGLDRLVMIEAGKRGRR